MAIDDLIFQLGVFFAGIGVYCWGISLYYKSQVKLYKQGYYVNWYQKLKKRGKK